MTGQLPIGLLARNEGALDKRGHLHLRFCQRSEFTFNLGFPLNSFVQLRQGIARSRAHTENFPIDFATTLLNSSLACCQAARAEQSTSIFKKHLVFRDEHSNVTDLLSIVNPGTAFFRIS